MSLRGLIKEKAPLGLTGLLDDIENHPTRNAKRNYKILRFYKNTVNPKSRYYRYIISAEKELRNALRKQTVASLKRKQTTQKKKQTNIKKVYNVNTLYEFLRTQSFPLQVELHSTIADVKTTLKFFDIIDLYKWYMVVTRKERYISDKDEDIEQKEIEILGRKKKLFKKFTITVTPIRGACNTKTTKTKIIKGRHYEFNTVSYPSRRNNCGIISILRLYEVINDDTSVTDLRRCLKESRRLIGHYNALTMPEMMDYIRQHIHESPTLNKSEPLIIVDKDTDIQFDFGHNKYILLDKEHYSCITEAKHPDYVSQKTRRGLLTWDFETRPNHSKFDLVNVDGKQTKSYYLQPAICNVYYRKYKSDEKNELHFTTTPDKCCSRQFIDWLHDEHNAGRSYTCVSHNGANFDHYFLYGSLSKDETKAAKHMLRGMSIIRVELYGHIFKDSCLYLTASLDTICKNFKVKTPKIKAMIVEGREMTTTEMCFYKPELSILDFVKLKQTEPEFWKLYDKYCMVDCISLFEVWEEYTKAVNAIIFSLDVKLLRTCSLNTSITIAGLSKKIITKLLETNSWYKEMCQFNDTNEKDNFLRQFIRGGISHCAKPGNYNGTEVVGIDIKSQYPACMIYSQIPIGESKFVTKLSNNEYGYYHIKDLVFDVPINTKIFRPIAEKPKKGSLIWDTGKCIKEAFVDTWMLQYLVSRFKLKSYIVVKGLVSNKYTKSSNLFGKYVNTLYAQKARQDALPADKRNNALRESIKLFLNSLSGKLVENPDRYTSLAFSDEGHHVFNGVKCDKKQNNDNRNKLLTCGLQVYFYSKMLLFEYINMLPNGPHDVIATETDSVYFEKSKLPHFESLCSMYKDGQFPSVQIGDRLGNMCIEKTSSESIFTGKKNYYFNPTAMKMKGISAKTIDDHGKTIQLVKKEMFEKAARHEATKFEYKTLKKHLMCDNIHISTHNVSRTLQNSLNLLNS